jgi:hypothetical protein
MRSRPGLGLCLLAAAATVSCGSVCGLAIHNRLTYSNSAGAVPCCGGFTFKDVTLTANGDTEFQLASTARPAVPGLVDAFLVPASCGKLFEGAYPGAVPLCQVLLGPTAPGKVSSLAKLSSGTYRLWLQGYSSNSTDATYLIDIEIWDHSCSSPLLN